MDARWLTVGAMVLVAASVPVQVQRIEGPLRIEASLPDRAYRPGEQVVVTLQARNTGTAPLNLAFSTGQRFDLSVRRPRGEEVWRWSHDKAFIQVVESVTLDPGETMSFQVTWDQKDFQGRLVDPGAYRAVAVFMGRTGIGREIRLPPLEFVITGS